MVSPPSKMKVKGAVDLDLKMCEGEKDEESSVWHSTRWWNPVRVQIPGTLDGRVSMIRAGEGEVIM